MITNMKYLLQHASKNNYCIPAFDIINLESIMAIVKAAEKKKSPVILMIYEGYIQETSLGAITKSVWEVAGESEMPIAYHLDHGMDFENVKNIIEKGFSSVMFDGSTLSYKENIKKTSEIVKKARQFGVDVEAELGHVGIGEDDNVEDSLTEPGMAREFVEMTGVDALAVAVGTAHGTYKGVPRLDFERLEKIDKEVSVPLVLHGGSGTGMEAIKRAIKLGINKLNIYTDMSLAAEEKISSLYSRLLKDDRFEVVDILNVIKKEFYRIAVDYIDCCGSTNRAAEFAGIKPFKY